MLFSLILALALQTPTPLTAASPELRISYDQFRKLYDSGNVLVLDVRGDISYRAGHIPGAISLPFDQVEKKIPDLKKETRPIVTYCS
jgi:rhodanese-related sulfurtransferase